jgi:hypothetical protein
MCACISIRGFCGHRAPLRHSILRLEVFSGRKTKQAARGRAEESLAVVGSRSGEACCIADTRIAGIGPRLRIRYRRFHFVVLLGAATRVQQARRASLPHRTRIVIAVRIDHQHPLGGGAHSTPRASSTPTSRTSTAKTSWPVLPLSRSMMDMLWCCTELSAPRGRSVVKGFVSRSNRDGRAQSRRPKPTSARLRMHALREIR